VQEPYQHTGDLKQWGLEIQLKTEKTKKDCTSITFINEAINTSKITNRFLGESLTIKQTWNYWNNLQEFLRTYMV
jgi:hypothetical protein